MMPLYTLGMMIYGLAVSIAGIFVPKARLWIEGRKNWQKQIREARDPKRPCIWFHCASLGEFEQGRNLIEAIRQMMPESQIVLSFFSPSGYEIRKNYAHVDLVCYLPLDTPSNAAAWVSLLKPDMAFIIKYELWLNLFAELKKANIPLFLVSARVRPQGRGLFQSIRNNLHRQGFDACTHIFAQDEQAAQRIRKISPQAAVSVSYDTRFDRVWSTRQAHTEIPELEHFKQGRCIMAGSSWPKDEEYLFAAYKHLRKTHDVCLVLAPHEINQDRINKWSAEFPQESIRFSEIGHLRHEHRILWIDNIGMLSRLYAYADIALIGGAWKQKVHNILEAVVFGCPVIFGPNYHNLPEADELIRMGGAFSVNHRSALVDCLEKLLVSEDRRHQIQQSNMRFVKDRRGATEFILNWCKKAGYLNKAEPR